MEANRTLVYSLPNSLIDNAQTRQLVMSSIDLETYTGVAYVPGATNLTIRAPESLTKE